MTLRIALRGVSIGIPGRAPVDPPIDIEIEAEQRGVLLGRSGSGKTLFARLALGMMPPAPLTVSGAVAVEVDGWTAGTALGGGVGGGEVSVVAGLRDRIAYLPQGGRENLVPGWSLDRHLDELGVDAATVYELTERLGVGDRSTLATAGATGLSEGMIRRVLLAIALARGPDLLIADEPTTGLDPESRSAVADLLVESGPGLLVTTHDPRFARRVGTRFYRVEDGRAVASSDDLGDADGPFADWVVAEPVH